MTLRLRLFLICIGFPYFAIASDVSPGQPEDVVALPAGKPPPTASVPAKATPAAGKIAPPTAGDAIEDLIKEGLAKLEEGNFEAAKAKFHQVISHEATVGQHRTALLGFARALRKNNELTKSSAVYEKILKDYPLDEDAPDIYLELGRVQRALGAHKSAVNRFYSVINSTLKLPESGALRYRQLALTAQFEIAETYFQAGDYAEASRFYSRLRLLDLAPSDRAQAHFKSAYALFLAQDYIGAVSSLRAYLDQHPQDENVPEARYLLAVSYRRLNRPLEALVEVLELLRVEKTRIAQDPKRWAYWQRKTGNQIANEFYEQGDSANALTIYLTLAELSPEPNWRMPIMYQIGLCQERIGQIEDARKSYQSILDNVRAAPRDGAARLDQLAELARMAEWRLAQISWQQSAQQRLLMLLPPPSDEKTEQPPKHDARGNAPAAPKTVR